MNKKLYYRSPESKEHGEYMVPIVVKNKDYLVGYVHGMNLIQDVVIDSLKNTGIEIENLNIDLCLDSTRFNDIMENGKHESDLSSEELKKYYENLVIEKYELAKEHHPDNDNTVFEDVFMTVECICGLGVYSYKTSMDVPEENLICGICGRTIIDYTGHDDYEYEYNGNSDD